MTLLGDGGFRAGVAWGMVALVLALAISLGRWRCRPDLPVIGGVLLAGAALLALVQERGAPIALLLGVGALAGAGALVDLAAGWRPWTVAVPVGVLGAWLVASSPGVAEDAWVRPLLVATVLGGGLALVGFDRRWCCVGLVPPLLAISFAGLYLTVPDTEEAAIVLGAASAAAFLGLPRPLAATGTGGSLAVAGVLAWTASVGGAGRPGAVVGGVACLGVLVVEPLAGWLLPQDRWRANALAGLALFVLHTVLVVLLSRVAGLRTEAWEAAAVALAALGAGVVAAAVGQRCLGTIARVADASPEED